MSEKSEKGTAGGVICPWCDFVHQDVDDYCLPTDENPVWGECEECGKKFQVSKRANGFHSSIKPEGV